MSRILADQYSNLFTVTCLLTDSELKVIKRVYVDVLQTLFHCQREIDEGAQVAVFVFAVLNQTTTIPLRALYQLHGNIDFSPSRACFRQITFPNPR